MRKALLEADFIWTQYFLITCVMWLCLFIGIFVLIDSNDNYGD